MTTIFDVIENNFDSKKLDIHDILHIPGKDLYNFGEEVRRFSASYQLPQVSVDQNPIYIGGWPSANFWDVKNSKLILTNLLYSGQILVKDPISDWFSYEQYQLPRRLSARSGFFDTRKNRVNILGTREFLSIVIPLLYNLKPLVEKGTVVLIPSTKYEHQLRHQIDNLADALFSHSSINLGEFTHRFKPVDLAVEDNVRGLFIFAGGNREEQILREIKSSMRYFATEYLLSIVNGFNYVAPFSYESYLGEKGLNSIVNSSVKNKPGSHVLSALFNSSFPLYSNLTPELISTLKDDDNFAGFRSELYKIYTGVPSNTDQGSLKAYIDELENVHLRPILLEIEKESKRGIISKLGLKYRKAGFRFAASVLASKVATPEAPLDMVLASAAVTTILPELLFPHKMTGPKVIWQKLYDHNCEMINELEHAQVQSSPRVDKKESLHMGNFKGKELPIPKTVKETSNDKELWGIPEQPSLSVTLTAGALMWERVSNIYKIKAPDDYPLDNIYEMCPCRSGRKFKFCCRGLEKVKMVK